MKHALACAARFGLLAFALGGALGGRVATAQTLLGAGGDLSAIGPLAVDVLEFRTLVDEPRQRPVPIKVHLPRAVGRHPVVVLSHGGGGSWDANFAQAGHLASHGYAVLALEHVGSNTEVMQRSLRYMANLRAMTRDPAEVLGRPKDVSFAIDQAMRWSAQHESLRARFDLERVGVLGHSFGAYTALVVAGARPALDWLQPPVAPGRGLGPDLRDARIQCGVTLSPQGPGEPFFIEASYASLKVPMLGISGSRDQQQQAEPQNRRAGFGLWPAGDKTFIWLNNADHTAFSDSTGSGRRMLPSQTRDDVQPLVRAATLAFFNGCLRNDPRSKEQLGEAALRAHLRGRIDAVEVSFR
jgi:predicted dienelactone hydrolase